MTTTSGSRTLLSIAIPRPTARPTRSSPARTPASVAARAATASAVRRGVSSSDMPTAESIAWRPMEASQQPLRPQPQGAEESPTGMCPTSPAKPAPPRMSSPSWTMPAPMPTVPVR